MLEAKGRHALAIDLPGHGADPTPPENVAFEDYVQAVCSCLDRLPTPALLVGHSNGSIVAKAAERLPERVKAVVYVAALVPPNGAPTMQLVQTFDPEYLKHIVFAPDQRTAGIQPEGAREFLYGLCPEDVAEDAISRFTPEPIAPYLTPIHLGEPRAEEVPQYYIECLQDRVAPLALQRTTQSALRCKRTYTLDTDHSPFFSATQGLVDILLSIPDTI